MDLLTGPNTTFWKIIKDNKGIPAKVSYRQRKIIYFLDETYRTIS